MTAEHCIGYAVRLVDNIADSAAKYESQVIVITKERVLVLLY